MLLFLIVAVVGFDSPCCCRCCRCCSWFLICYRCCCVVAVVVAVVIVAVVGAVGFSFVVSSVPIIGSVVSI